MDDLISRQAAIDILKQFKPEIIPYEKARSYVEETIDTMYNRIEELPSVQPDRKLIDDYMWKIKQNISTHTSAEGVIAIKYYLEQIYEQIYGKGEKTKWMI